MFFFFNDTATTEIYTLSLHDALPISPDRLEAAMTHSSYPLQALLYAVVLHRFLRWRLPDYDPEQHLGGVLYLYVRRSEEHTSELQSRQYLVCRLLLEKKELRLASDES